MKKSDFCELEIKLGSHYDAALFAQMLQRRGLVKLRPEQFIAHTGCSPDTTIRFLTGIRNPFPNADGLFRLQFDKFSNATLGFEVQVGTSIPLKEPMRFSCYTHLEKIYSSFQILVDQPSLDF